MIKDINIQNFKNNKQSVLRLYPILKPSDKSVIAALLDTDDSIVTTMIGCQHFLFWSSLAGLGFAQEYRSGDNIDEKMHARGVRCFKLTDFGKEMLPIVLDLALQNDKEASSLIKQCGTDFLAGQSYYHSGDYEQALECYSKGAVQGSCACHFMIGLFYEQGFWVDKNYMKAYDWYQKAIDKKYRNFFHQSEAYLHLGVMHELNQIDTNKSAEQAFQYYQKSADLGNVTAFVKLYFFHGEGIGTEINKEKAIRFLIKAAHKSHKGAAKKLSEYYIDENNYHKAFVYSLIAEINGEKMSKASKEIGQNIADNKKEQIIKDVIRTEFSHSD